MKWNRRTVLSRAVFLSLAVSPAMAFAQVDSSPYVAGSLGVALQNNRGISESTKGVPGSIDSSARFGTGLAATLTPGLAFNNSLRSDLELSYQDKPGKGDSIDEKAYSALANVWIDVIHQYGYFIYFGGGLGGADIKLHSSNGGDSAITPAWQIGGGAGITVLSNWALSADFRRLSAFEKPSFKLDGQESLETRYGTNAVTLSLRYSFGRLSSPLLGLSSE